jgi:hypothetical protein
MFGNTFFKSAAKVSLEIREKKALQNFSPKKMGPKGAN